MLQDAAMEEFVAEVRFRFRAEDLVAAGAELRKLSEASQSVGFKMQTGKVVPAPIDPGSEDGGTSYAPLIPET